MSENIPNETIRKNIEEIVNAPPRKLILELGQMVTSRIGFTVTVEDPEYWGLASVLSDEMAEVALKMKVRKPMTFEQLLKATGKEREHLQEMLDEMSEIGILEYNWENRRREKQYVLPMFVPGSAEFMNMNMDRLKETPQLGYFFERMSRLALEKVSPMVPPGGSGIGMHVIPVEKSIEMENQSVDVEHISHWLKKYEGKYAASPCSCRMSRETMGEGCADDARDWCIAVGDMADYVVETNKGGRYITYEEVLDILEKAEDNGFVHQITNIDGENKIFAICNCNPEVCYGLRTSQLFNTPNLSRSAYVARTKTENCVACGKCVEYCPAGAVKLGQKLCTNDGPVKYPKQQLPDAAKWGPEKWDEDYRDKNRINCYDTGTAPCKTACPAHIAVQGYIDLAKEGRYTDALALIKKDNPFPAVCGHVCNRACEDACTRGNVDDPVAIDDIKKFIAELDLYEETRYIPPVVQPSLRGPFKEKVAIIGAGPAGLSCAFYLAELGYKPTVFEKNKTPGGMMVYGIPSFKLERKVVDAEIDILREMGVEIKCGVEVGKDVTLDELRKEGYGGFYIAIGCQGGKKAGIPGEDAEGVMTAVDFLRLVGDNEDHRLTGKTVVIGGGNVATDVARSSVRCGADETHMYSLESRDIMPASDEEIAESESEGVEIHCGWGPKEVLTENGKVTGVVLRKCESVYDDEGNFNPSFCEIETVEVPCDNVFFSIGQDVIWGDLLKDSNVELGRGDLALADSLTYQTAHEDIFVGGDIYTGPKYAIDAIAAGKEGAISLHRFVQPHSSLTIGRNRRDFIELDKDNIELEDYDKAPRQSAGMDESIDAKTSFRDAHKTLTEEQVKVEASRCLDCGASIVDTNKCIGCGICTTKCEFDAIHMYRENPKASKMRPAEQKLRGILPHMIKRGFKIKFNQLRGKK